MKKLSIGLLAFTSLSVLAADKYSCQVIGEFTNLDSDESPDFF